MGMFDTVWIKCPSCTEEIDVQSKTGDCFLDEYNLENAPLDVIVGTMHPTTCPCCGTTFIVEFEPHPVVIVRKMTKEEQETWEE